MDFTLLAKKIGLDEKQAKVYIALLESGESSMTEIARCTRLKRSSVYLIVASLMQLGLLSEVKKGKRKVYTAIHPNRLRELAQWRLNNVDEVLPKLIHFYNEQKNKSIIHILEGEEGIKSVYRELLTSLSDKKEALWFSRVDTLRAFAGSMLDEYKKTISSVKNPRVRELNYNNLEAREWAKEIKPYGGKHYHIRLLSNEYDFGSTDNLLFENKLVIFSFEKHQFVNIIESVDIVKTFRAIYEAAWKTGEEI